MTSWKSFNQLFAATVRGDLGYQIFRNGLTAMTATMTCAAPAFFSVFAAA